MHIQEIAEELRKRIPFYWLNIPLPSDDDIIRLIERQYVSAKTHYYHADLGDFINAWFKWVEDHGEHYPMVNVPKRFKRLVEDFNTANKLHNKRIYKLIRGRRWQEEKRKFRQKWGIPDKGLSYRAENKWYKHVFGEQEESDSSLLAFLFNDDIDELISKFTSKRNRLDKVPFIFIRMLDYLVLNSRYANHRWENFTGYCFTNTQNEPEILWPMSYIKLPYSFQKVVIRWIKSGVPEDADSELETKEGSFGIAWKLKKKNSHST